MAVTPVPLLIEKGPHNYVRDPLTMRHLVSLTSLWKFDKMHRRAGRDAAPQRRSRPHADAHKNCPLGRCGTRPGAYSSGAHPPQARKSAKITAWRKAKQNANRAYLEEKVYGRSQTDREAS